MKDPIPNLELTGERTIPDHPVENYWYTRHVVAYRYIASIASGQRVADIGCGEGYGPAMLAKVAEDVEAVDAAPYVIEHAKRKYNKENLHFKVMDVEKLNFSSNYFDLVSSLQVVEHLTTSTGYLEEITRILKISGKAVISTPNRLTISPGSETPLNPFHIREFSPEEFEDILAGHFRTVKIAGVFHAGWLRANDFLRVVDFIKYYEMGRHNPRYWTHRLLTPRVKEKQFKISGENIDRCHDIIAICKK